MLLPVIANMERLERRESAAAVRGAAGRRAR
jgi:hypothetical protein